MPTPADGEGGFGFSRVVEERSDRLHTGGAEAGTDRIEARDDPLGELGCRLLDAENGAELGEVVLEQTDVGETLPAVLGEQEGGDTGGFEAVTAETVLVVERAAHAPDDQIGLEIENLLGGRIFLRERRDGAELLRGLGQGIWFFRRSPCRRCARPPPI